MDAEPSHGVEQLSRLLLQGWTMLAETCPRPGCNMPLARSRDGLVKCSSCGLTNRPSDSPPASTSPHLPSVQPSATPRSSAPTSGTPTRRPASTRIPPSSQPVISSSPRAPPLPPSSSRTVAAAATPASAEALLGDRLLRGWTLLSDACAVCATPLVRDTSNVRRCVLCEGENDTAVDTSALVADTQVQTMVDMGTDIRQGTVDVATTGAQVVDVVAKPENDQSRNADRQSLPQQTTVDHINVDEELLASERAVAACLRALRDKLHDGVSEQESTMTAMTKACDAIAAARRAIDAGAGLQCNI